MPENPQGVPPPETGTSIAEQGAIRSLALDVQEVVSIYKKQREEGRDGTDVPLVFLASDIDQLKDLGVVDKYKGALTKIGADPIIRFAVLSQIDKSGQNYEQATDKSPYLKEIRNHLELGEALGLDQSAGNPDFEDAAKLFSDFKQKYSDVEMPEAQSTPPAETPSPSEPADQEPPPTTVEGTPANASFGQVLAELQSVNPDDVIIQGYSDLFRTLNDSALAERLEHLASALEAGLTPANLTELTGFSEDVARRLEELGSLDPAFHEENVKNARNALWISLTNAPTERPATPTVTEDKQRIPENATAQDMIKLLNRFLGKSGEETDRNIEVPPAVLARYIKETVKLPKHANFSRVPELKIIQDPWEGNVLEISGRIGTPAFDSFGSADFYLRVANKADGGIHVIDKNIFEATGEVKKAIDQGEAKIEAINELLIDQTNQRINKNWETANFHISDDVIVFEFKRREAPESRGPAVQPPSLEPAAQEDEEARRLRQTQEEELEGLIKQLAIKNGLDPDTTTPDDLMKLLGEQS